ncbi:MAG: hydrogenase 3 maturation endopeptidase HyCI [Candidatus Eisenbacteria bacterium]
MLGVGNALRADDGAGPAVAELLRPRFPDRVFDGGQAPENFTGPMRRADPDTVLIVDAADFGGEAGEIRVADADDVGGLMTGTHAPPLSMFMRLLSEDTGANVYLLAIQVESMELGGAMSPRVREAVEGLSSEMASLLEGGDPRVE